MNQQSSTPHYPVTRPSKLVRQANWTTTLLLTTAITSFSVFASSYAGEHEPVGLSQVSTSISNHALQLLGCNDQNNQS